MKHPRPSAEVAAILDISRPRSKEIVGEVIEEEIIEERPEERRSSERRRSIGKTGTYCGALGDCRRSSRGSWSFSQ